MRPLRHRHSCSKAPSARHARAGANCQLLRDHTAERNSDYPDFRQAEPIEERDRVVGVIRHGVRTRRLCRLAEPTLVVRGDAKVTRERSVEHTGPHTQIPARTADEEQIGPFAELLVVEVYRGGTRNRHV